MNVRRRMHLARSLAALVVLGAGTPASACMNEMMVTTRKNPLAVLMVSTTMLGLHYVSLRYLPSALARIGTLLAMAAAAAFVAVAVGTSLHSVDVVAVAVVLLMIVLAHAITGGRAKADPEGAAQAASPRIPKQRRLDGYADRPAE